MFHLRGCVPRLLMPSVWVTFLWPSRAQGGKPHLGSRPAGVRPERAGAEGRGGRGCRWQGWRGVESRGGAGGRGTSQARAGDGLLQPDPILRAARSAPPKVGLPEQEALGQLDRSQDVLQRGSAAPFPPFSLIVRDSLSVQSSSRPVPDRGLRRPWLVLPCPRSPRPQRQESVPVP